MLLGCPSVHAHMRGYVCPFVTFETMFARVVKFHIWNHHKNYLTSVFFLSELSLFLELGPFAENHNESLSAKFLKKYLS